LDAIATATVLVFSNKYHKISFAAPKIEKLPLKIKALQENRHEVTKTGVLDYFVDKTTLVILLSRIFLYNHEIQSINY